MNRKNQNLQKFLDQVNFSRRWGNKKELTIEDCIRDEVHMYLFTCLDSMLSPENLCCDGELRGRALDAKRHMLNMAWQDLLRVSRRGSDISFEEIYKYAEEHPDLD